MFEKERKEGQEEKEREKKHLSQKSEFEKNSS